MGSRSESDIDPKFHRQRFSETTLKNTKHTHTQYWMKAFIRMATHKCFNRKLKKLASPCAIYTNIKVTNERTAELFSSACTIHIF